MCMKCNLIDKSLVDTFLQIESRFRGYQKVFDNKTKGKWSY